LRRIFFFLTAVVVVVVVACATFGHSLVDNRCLNYLKSLTPFLPATVFFGPFRVRALVRVR
jgi:hypothetical protein